MAPPSSAIPIDALISFHSQERVLFKRLVFEWEMKPIVAMGAIAFWMWLESIGHPSFIQDMVTMSDEMIRCIAVEGVACSVALVFDASNPHVAGRRDVPTATRVPGSPIDLGYLHNFWDLACDGVMSILENICPMIFGDMLAIAFSRRMFQDACGVNDRSIIDAIGEGNNTVSATSNTRVKNKNGILGPYNGVRGRRGLVNQAKSPTESGIVLMPFKEDSAFVSYDEGTSKGPFFPLRVQLCMKGNHTIGGYKEKFTLESKNILSNMLNMQQEIQSNHLQMLRSQSVQMPFHPFNGVLDTRRLSLSPRNECLMPGGIAQALVPSNNMGISTGSLSSCSLMHQGTNLELTTPTWLPIEQIVPQDERTLFITFSNGYPLDEEDLYEFFSRRYGGLEEICIQHVDPGAQPLFARAVFYMQSTCLGVLAGNEKAKFMIKGRHVWARRYVPKRKRRAYRERR